MVPTSAQNNPGPLSMFTPMRTDPHPRRRKMLSRKNVSKSPAHKITNTHKIGPSDILVFTDASWQNCPDSGRSTTGYYIFYQGGVIEGNSQ
eukprot:3017268-Ditylum_brightwellii.AAC.1